jgi:type I restriction enzyme S subunit
LPENGIVYYTTMDLLVEAMKKGVMTEEECDTFIRGVSNLPLTLPGLEEQNLIVEELERRLTVCDKLEESISLGLLQAESLRQSILKKAFEGTLVHSDKAAPVFG